MQQFNGTNHQQPEKCQNKKTILQTNERSIKTPAAENTGPDKDL